MFKVIIYKKEREIFMKNLLLLPLVPLLIMATQNFSSERTVQDYFDNDSMDKMLEGIQYWVKIGRENELPENQGLFKIYVQMNQEGPDCFTNKKTLTTANLLFNTTLNSPGTRTIFSTVQKTNDERLKQIFRITYAFTLWDILNENHSQRDIILSENYLQNTLQRSNRQVGTDEFILEYLSLNQTVSFDKQQERAWVASLICLGALTNLIQSITPQ